MLSDSAEAALRQQRHGVPQPGGEPRTLGAPVAGLARVGDSGAPNRTRAACARPRQQRLPLQALAARPDLEDAVDRHRHDRHAELQRQ